MLNLVFNLKGICALFLKFATFSEVQISQSDIFEAVKYGKCENGLPAYWFNYDILWHPS